MTAVSDEAARILLEIKAAYAYDGKDPFVFTSGRKSPVYVDIRKLISFHWLLIGIGVCGLQNSESTYPRLKIATRRTLIHFCAI